MKKLDGLLIRAGNEDKNSCVTKLN